jgi:thiol-disulfide isomerase/thioredoxin
VKARLAGGSVVAILVALIVVSAVRVSQSWSALRAVTVPTGVVAPDFELPLLDGGRFRLSSARGDVVALAFWATWCEPCREELPALDALARKLKGSGVRFYAVNIEAIDRQPSILKFKNGNGLTIPVILDGGEVSATYRVETIPHLVVIDRAGRVRDTFDGARDPSVIEAAVTAAAKSP